MTTELAIILFIGLIAGIIGLIIRFSIKSILRKIGQFFKMLVRSIIKKSR